MVPAATLAAHSQASSPSSPRWGASIRKIPAATSSNSPVIRPVRTAPMTHLMTSVFHRLIGSGWRCRHRGPISVVAYPVAASTEELMMVPAKKPAHQDQQGDVEGAQPQGRMRGQRPVPGRCDGNRVGQEISGQRAGRPGGGHEGRELPPDLAGCRRQAGLQHAGGQAYPYGARTLAGPDDERRPSRPRPAHSDTGPGEQRCGEAGRDHDRRVGGSTVHGLLRGAEGGVSQRQLSGDCGAV
jgi:hypothetical protein